MELIKRKCSTDGRARSLEEILWNLPLPEMLCALKLIDEFDGEIMRMIWKKKDHARIEEWRLRLEKRRFKRQQFLEFRLRNTETITIQTNANLLRNYDVRT